MKVTEMELLIFETIQKAVEWCDEYNFEIDRPPSEVEPWTHPGNDMYITLRLKKVG